jgi:hypothetical protein
MVALLAALVVGGATAGAVKQQRFRPRIEDALGLKPLGASAGAARTR